MTGPPVWTWKVSIKVQTLSLYILCILFWCDESQCHLWCRCGEATAGAIKESGSAGCSLAGCDQTECGCGVFWTVVPLRMHVYVIRGWFLYWHERAWY